MHPPVTGDEKTVSVPYRGATFLNILCGLGFMISRIMFPSPIGELHFSIITTLLSINHGEDWFPSPIGELHFSIFQEAIKDMNILHSFRPLSGSYISQFGKTYIHNIFNCFRPLSGSYISQSQAVCPSVT